MINGFIYRFNAIPIKIPIVVFIEMGKNNTIQMEPQQTTNRLYNLKKEG